MHNRVNLIVNVHGTVRICRRIITRRIGSGDCCSNMRIVLQPMRIHLDGVTQRSQIRQVHHYSINHMATNIQVHHIINFRIATDCTADNCRRLPQFNLIQYIIARYRIDSDRGLRVSIQRNGMMCCNLCMVQGIVRDIHGDVDMRIGNQIGRSNGYVETHLMIATIFHHPGIVVAVYGHGE